MALPVTSVLWKDYVDNRAVQESDFIVATSEIDPASLQDGEVLVELLYLSVDPYLRGRMRRMKSYYFIGPFESGKPLSSGGIGLVKASKAAAYAEGDVVSGMLPWSSHAVLDEAAQEQLAWWLGQLLKNVYGCKVIGSAGSDDKVSLLKQLGFDEAFNYKTTDTAEALKAAAPDGIDIYFDNVGGPTLEAVLDLARTHARVVACGMISQYDLPDEEKYGVKNLMNMMAGGNTGKAVVKVVAEDPFPVKK
ncbi:hypothetical protein COO60DRAFT_1636219 [Scenedesmus sp. NREL 46B-D3]|nr:hypothetical protein COO60DRAFT_1636219 [Scenedesmus sp. NREL 46B-D3]